MKKRKLNKLLKKREKEKRSLALRQDYVKALKKENLI